MSVVAQIWPQVKAANPHLSSVTEIGAVVGAMWRDLDPVEKQRYNDQFNKQKVTMKLLFHGSPPPPPHHYDKSSSVGSVKFKMLKICSEKLWKSFGIYGVLSTVH